MKASSSACHLANIAGRSSSVTGVVVLMTGIEAKTAECVAP
jgi:hypothetical protein